MNSNGFPSPFDVSDSTSGRRTNDNTKRKIQSPQSTSVIEQSSWINRTTLDRQEDPARIIDWIENLEKRVKHILGQQGNEIAVLSKQKHLEEQRNKYKHILFDSQFEKLKHQLENDEKKEVDAKFYRKRQPQNIATRLEDQESGSGISDDDDESKNESVTDSEDGQEVQEVISISSLESDDENQEEMYPEASEMEEESEQEVESESEPYAERVAESLEFEAGAAVSEAESEIESVDENIEIQSQSEDKYNQRIFKDEHCTLGLEESLDNTSSSPEGEKLSDLHVSYSDTLSKSHLKNEEFTTDDEEVRDEVYDDLKNMLNEDGSEIHSEDVISIESNNSGPRDNILPDIRVEESDNFRASAHDRTEEDALENYDDSDDLEIYENAHTEEQFYDASLRNGNAHIEKNNQEDTENFDDTIMQYEDAPEKYEAHNTFNFNDNDHPKENDSKKFNHEHQVNEEFQVLQDIALRAFNVPANGVSIIEDDQNAVGADFGDIARQVKHVVENEGYNSASHTSDIKSTKLEYVSKGSPAFNNDAKESSSEPSDVLATLFLADIPTSAQSGDPNIKDVDDSKVNSRYEASYTDGSDGSLHDRELVKQNNYLEHHKEGQSESMPDNIELPQSDVEKYSGNYSQSENGRQEKNEVLDDIEVSSKYDQEPVIENRDSDTELKKSFSSETVNGSTPPPPIFKSLKDESDPMTVLNDLKAIERRFGLQLESVKALEEEIFLQKNTPRGKLKKACDYIKGMLSKFNKKHSSYKSEVLRPSLKDVHLSDILSSEYSDSDLEAKAENVPLHTESPSNKDIASDDVTETLIKLKKNTSDATSDTLRSQLPDDEVLDNVVSIEKESIQVLKDGENDFTKREMQEMSNKDKRQNINNKDSSEFRETESTRRIFVIEPEENAEPICTEYNWTIETGFVQENVISPTSVEEPVTAKAAGMMHSERHGSTEELKNAPISSEEQVFPDLIIEPEEDDFKISVLPYENENETENDAFDVLVPSFIEEPENPESTTLPVSNGEKDETEFSQGGLKRKYSETQSHFTPLKKIRKVFSALGSLIFYRSGNNLNYKIPKPCLTPVEEELSNNNKRNKRKGNSILKPSILNKKRGKDKLKNNINFCFKDDLEDNTKGKRTGDGDATKQTIADGFQEIYDKGGKIASHESEIINYSGNRTSRSIDENHESSIAKSKDDIEPKVGKNYVSSNSTSVQQTDSLGKTYLKKNNSRKVFGLDISEVDLLPSHSLRNGRKFGNENEENISANTGIDSASSERESLASRPDSGSHGEKAEELRTLAGQRSDSTSTVLDYPAQRTRSKSPLKRSLQEILSSSNSAVPFNPHTRPSSRKKRKGSDKKQDLDENSVSESNTRGRRNHRN